MCWDGEYEAERDGRIGRDDIEVRRAGERKNNKTVQEKLTLQEKFSNEIALHFS